MNLCTVIFVALLTQTVSGGSNIGSSGGGGGGGGRIRISTMSERLLLAKDTLFPPLVAKTYDQLIYVTFPRGPEPMVRLESEKMGYRACELRLPEATLRLNGPLGLVSLASGKLVLGLLGRLPDNQQQQQLLSLILDPERCQLAHSLIILQPAAADWAQLPPILLPGEREFELFLSVCNASNSSGDEACRLRFDESGRLLATTVLPRPGPEVHVWAINSVAEPDLSQGYLYAEFAANRTLLRRLDPKLQPLQERVLPGSLTYLYSGLFGQVASCSLEPGPSRLDCQLLDGELRLKARARLDGQPFRRFVRAARLVGLPRGGALLYLLLQLEGERHFASYLQPIDAHGRIGRAVRFQEDACREPGPRLVASEMREDLMCLSLSCRHSVSTKCVAFVPS